MIPIYTPKINPIPLLLKLAGISILLGIAVYGFWLFYDTGETEISVLVSGTILLSIFGVSGVRVALFLADDFKWVRFYDDHFTIHYPLRFKHLNIIKTDINGYFARNYIQQVNQRSIILYFPEGRNVEFINKNYWSFSEFEAFLASQFELVGEENHNPKIWSR